MSVLFGAEPSLPLAVAILKEVRRRVRPSNCLPPNTRNANALPHSKGITVVGVSNAEVAGSGWMNLEGST